MLNRSKIPYVDVLNIIFYIAILCNITRVVAKCPNDCSKRGYCTDESVCICENLYTLAPDCSKSNITI